MVNFFKSDNRIYPDWVKPKVLQMMQDNPDLTCAQIAEKFTKENNYFLNKNMVIGIRHRAGLSQPKKKVPKESKTKAQGLKNRSRYNDHGLTETFEEYKARRKAERAAGIVRESYSDDY